MEYAGCIVLLLYVLAIFVGSFLLFLVQPMTGKMALPLFGGAPAVWITCMLFFQAALLAGYLYAHLGVRYMGVRGHAILHAVLLIAPWLVLPIVIGDNAATAGGLDPAWRLLAVLALGVGIPFFVVSANAPLLQRWFHASRHSAGRDPYFLYAASNVGSMLALLSYPLLFEPVWWLETQSMIWTAGYGLLMVLVVGCAASMWRGAGITAHHSHSNEENALSAEQGSIGKPQKGGNETSVAGGRATPVRVLRWIGWTFVPSSMMLAVTTHITMDLVVAPLLWVIPLALYLLTFILVFARRQLIPHWVMVRAMPAAVVIVMVVLLSRATEPTLVIVALHLLAFFIVSMVCHGELVRDRPDPTHLTTFYLFMGVGGMLGGVFNALVAPAVFTGILELPITLVMACLIAPVAMGGTIQRMLKNVNWGDLAWPAGLAAVTGALLFAANVYDVAPGPQRTAVTLALPLIVVYVLRQSSLRFALAVAVVLVISGLDPAWRGNQLDAERGFFGVHRVTRAEVDLFHNDRHWHVHRLYHGTTLHGKQLVDPETGQPAEPRTGLTYYHEEGPVGHILTHVVPPNAADAEGQAHGRRIGVVGLGAGTLAAYAEPGDVMTFYEIDPIVLRFAEDTRFFTFVSEARHRGAEISTVLGDARLTMRDVPDGAFDILVLDAFSSDVVPMHLITREAVQEFMRTVKDDGILMFHLSSRALDLSTVIANIADSLETPCLLRDDVRDEPGSLRMATAWHPSTWAVLTRSEEVALHVRRSPDGFHWLPALPDPSKPVWTDQYSNVLSALRW